MTQSPFNQLGWLCIVQSFRTFL